MRIKEEEEEMAAAGGSQVVKVKREIIEACLKCSLCNKVSREATTISFCLHTFCRKCIFDKLSEEEYDRCPYVILILSRQFACDKIQYRPYLAKYYSQDIFPVKRKKVDAPEVREHEANNPDVTPSSLGGCRFSAEEPLEIDDSTEDYPVSSCASKDLSK